MSLHVKQFGDMVKELMDKHGLFSIGWDYGYDRAKKRLGQCVYREKILSFSLPFVESNTLDMMKNTVLHEIAHALVGPGQDHNLIWKKKALEVGAKPVACNNDSLIIKPIGRYAFTCMCTTHYMHRMPKYTKRRCRDCGVIGEIVVVRNY